MAAKTNAERQKEYQDRLRRMSPMERHVKETGVAFEYTPAEQALADLIKSQTREIQDRAAELNQRLVQRVAGEGTPDEVLQHLAKFTRIQISNY